MIKYLSRLDCCLWFNTVRTVNDPKAEKIIDDLLKSIGKSKAYKPGNRKMEKLAMRVLVANLLCLHRQRHLSCIAYTRENRVYKKGIYNKLRIGMAPLLRVIDGLAAVGFLRKHEGFNFKHQDGGESRCSRIVIQPKLTNILSRASLKKVEISTAGFELIHRKDKNGNLKDYPVSPLVRKMRKQVKSYNALLAAHDISLTDEGYSQLRRSQKYKAPDMTNKSYHRVFNNGSFRLGGRFYGPWWQNIKNKFKDEQDEKIELRRYIRIDGHKTVEIDFTGLHLALCYALEGIDRTDLFGDEDPYYLEGFERIPVKTMFCIGVNSTDEASGIKAIRNKLRDNENYEYEEGCDLKKLISAFQSKHPRIEKYLFNGYGLTLQHLDAELMNSIISVFVDKEIVALSVHDSIIVDFGNEALATGIMLDCYAEFIKIGSISVKTTVGF